MTQTIETTQRTHSTEAPPPSLLLLLIAYYSFIVIGMPGGALNVAWAYIQDTFDLALDAVGLLLFAGSMGYLLITFASGPLIARFGLGRFLLVSTIAKIGGLLGMALSPSWALLLAANFISSIGGGAIDSGMNNYVVAHYRTSRLNWLHACFGLGSTIGPALATLFVADLGYSWRWIYLVVAGSSSALIVGLLLTSSRWQLAPAHTGEPDPANNHQANIRQTLVMPVLWVSMLLFALFAGIEVSAGQLTNPLFTKGRGIDPKTAGLWVSVFWGAFTAGRLTLGGLVDAAGKTRMVRLCLVGTTAGALLIAWNPAEAVSFIGLALMGFCISILFPTVLSETPRRFGAAHSANAIGLQIGSSGLGIALLPGLGAVLAERLGLEIIGPFLVATALAMLLLHEFVLWWTR